MSQDFHKKQQWLWMPFFSYAAILMQPLTRMFAIRSIIITTGILSTVGLIICSVAPSTSVLVFGLFIAGNALVTFRNGPGRICGIKKIERVQRAGLDLGERSVIYIFKQGAWRTSSGPICSMSGWPRAVNAISSAGHLRAPMGKFGRGGVTRPVPLQGRWGVARKVQNRLKSAQLFNSAWKCDEAWAIPKFLNRGPTGPAQVYRFFAGFASFCSRPGYLYLLFLNVTEA